MKTMTIDSPLGPIRLFADDALAGVFLPGQDAPDAREGTNAILTQAARELREYFAGTRTEFDVPMGPRGTEFQRTVWSALERIPFGETRTYGELARERGTS